MKTSAWEFTWLVHYAKCEQLGPNKKRVQLCTQKAMEGCLGVRITQDPETERPGHWNAPGNHTLWIKHSMVKVISLPLCPHHRPTTNGKSSRKWLNLVDVDIEINSGTPKNVIVSLVFGEQISPNNIKAKDIPGKVMECCLFPSLQTNCSEAIFREMGMPIN